MVCCAVTGCTSNNNKKAKNYSPNCRYFTFPTAKETRKMWVQKCYQKHNFNVKNARICWKHFSDEDFCIKEKILKLPKNKWKLKEDAVPLLNLPKSPKPKTSNQKNRNERIKKRNLLKNLQNTQENEDPTLNNNGVGEVPVVDTMNTIELEPTVTSNNRDTGSQTVRLQEESELLKKVRDLQKENLYLKQLLQKKTQEKNWLNKYLLKGSSES
ncbi:unnamed protein product [Psylliodes chrysocephalus]|uniref:THAP-type domain-containing protein n=1 Tax=Psylliodes chrysocephalus TaxID=3402493 RepID=A0A9P0CUY1_9CUCU|nr:unnamed protein product [Psylliodes chrysocephala]